MANKKSVASLNILQQHTKIRTFYIEYYSTSILFVISENELQDAYIPVGYLKFQG